MRFQSSEFDNVYIRSNCFGSENQYEMDSKDADCIAEVVEMLNEVRMSYFEKYFLFNTSSYSQRISWVTITSYDSPKTLFIKT